jgi:hypothetical protein
VVEESARNPDLLFVGTEHGVQVSLDRVARGNHDERTADGRGL